jgi:hypothetical protein
MCCFNFILSKNYNAVLGRIYIHVIWLPHISCVILVSGPHHIVCCHFTRGITSNTLSCVDDNTPHFDFKYDSLKSYVKVLWHSNKLRELSVRTWNAYIYLPKDVYIIQWQFLLGCFIPSKLYFNVIVTECSLPRIMFETPASCCSAIVGDHLKVYFLSEVKKIWDRNANVFHCNHNQYWKFSYAFFEPLHVSTAG